MVLIWLVLIGSVWGTTNALIKRGAVKAEEKQRHRNEQRKGRDAEGQSSWFLQFLISWFHLLCVWEYSVPFLANLSASILFIKQLGDGPINIAVPVTNAVTFACTALMSAALGESIDVGLSLVGIGFIVVGVACCVSPSIFV